jgi:hypothetical protein
LHVEAIVPLADRGHITADLDDLREPGARIVGFRLEDVVYWPRP